MPGSSVSDAVAGGWRSLRSGNPSAAQRALAPSAGTDHEPTEPRRDARLCIVLAVTTVARVVAVAERLRDARVCEQIQIGAVRSDAHQYLAAGFQVRVLGEHVITAADVEALVDEVDTLVVPAGFPRQALAALVLPLISKAIVPVRLMIAGKRWSAAAGARWLLCLLVVTSIPARWLLAWARALDGIGVLALLYLSPRGSVRSSPDGPVCHVIGGLGTGGAQRQLTEYLRHAARPLDDLKVMVLFEDDGRFSASVHATGVGAETVYAGLRRSRWHHLLGRALPHTVIALALRPLLNELRPRCVMSWLFVANVVTAAAVGNPPAPRLVAGIRNLSAWKTWPEYRRWWFRLADRRAARIADVLLANSRAVATDYEAWAGLERGRVDVIPNGVDVSRVQVASLEPVPPIPGLSPEVPTLVTVGRLSREKNIEMLVECCRRLENSGQPVNLVIVGHGELESELRAAIGRAGVGHRIALVGGSAHPEAYVERGDLFVLASRIEGMPNALLEAQALGRAAVATAAGGAAEVVEHEITGLVVPVDDVDAFVAAVRQLINDPEVRSAMGRRATARVARHFSIASVAKLIDAMTGRSGGAAA